MFNFLKDILICPECHGELLWEITDENNTNVIEAEAKCCDCKKIYPVKNGIGCFVQYENDSDDNWARGENWLKNLIADNPDIREKIMNTAIDEMNAADIMIKSMICKIEGNHSEATALNKIWRKKAYKEESSAASSAQIEYIVNSLKDEKDFILDIASGSGRLVSEFLEKTDKLIVSSDISFNIMQQAKKIAEQNGFGDRVSYIAFDLNKSPFRDKSVKIITTFVGLQNISYPEKIFGEIRRICGGKLYSACVFCCEDNIVNLKALEEGGLDKTWVKSKYIDEFDRAGFTSVIENSIITLDEPTPVGEIVKGVKIDGFPVETGYFEKTVIISS